MSIKVYEAWRISSKEFPGFYRNIQVAVVDMIARSLISESRYVDTGKMRDYYSSVPSAEYRTLTSDPIKDLKLRILFIIEAYQRSTMETTVYRLENGFPKRAELFAYPYSNFVAFGIFRGYINGLSTWINSYPGVSDFSYWNNTDRDERVSNREWNARGRFWNEILDSDPLRLYLSDYIGNTPVLVQQHFGIGYFTDNGNLEKICLEMYGEYPPSKGNTP